MPETVPKPIDCRTGDVLSHARVATADQDTAEEHRCRVHSTTETRKEAEAALFHDVIKREKQAA